jgi:hypothetical protein
MVETECERVRLVKKWRRSMRDDPRAPARTSDEPASSEPSLAERLKDHASIDRALARAVRDALLRHKQAGNPIAAWRDGRVVWIAAEDIPIAPEP